VNTRNFNRSKYMRSTKGDFNFKKSQSTIRSQREFKRCLRVLHPQEKKEPQ